MNETTSLLSVRIRRALPFAALVLLTACSSTPGRPHDPFEASNRMMYAINEPLDKYVAKPVAQFYVDYLPSPVRTAVSNFGNNIDDLFSGINGLLQGKLDKAGNDFGRVLLNTGFGLLGLIDIASDAGIPRGDEDLGQTFAYWGIPQGPYVFVPLLGPTTIRDGSGAILQGLASPTAAIADSAVQTVIIGLGAIDGRSQALGATSLIDQASLDPYTFVRRAYLQRREYLVHDGAPPSPKVEE
jgi:phospholipid-binding lipoprotein MlaA